MRPTALALAPLTLGRYFSVRACAGVGLRRLDADGKRTGEPVTVGDRSDGDLLALIDVALTEPPEQFATREALVAFAESVYEAVELDAQRETAMGLERCEGVADWCGFGPGQGDPIPPPPEAALDGPATDLAALWDLPLWVAVARGVVAASLERFRDALPDSHEGS